MKAKLTKPPMGWNSWDCYGASVTEEEVRRNAEYMAKNLKEFGWEYVVVDIQWFEPNAKSADYNKNASLIMDEYSRLMPAVNRFPSAEGGKGFKPLADYVHSLGYTYFKRYSETGGKTEHKDFGYNSYGGGNSRFRKCM